MGLSRLLHPHICSSSSFYFRTMGLARQTMRQLSTENKYEAARARKSQAVETYVRKYMEMHPESFPKISHVQKEIGGSWYTLKELLQNAKEKIFGNSKVQSDLSNDVKSTSAADATASSSEKSDHSEASNTLNALCRKSNIPPNAAPYTSGELSSDMMGETPMDAKRICNDLENTGSHNPRNLIQSSAQMNSNSEDNSVSRATSNIKHEICSEILLDATVSVGVCGSPCQDRIPEAASDINVDTVKVEGISNKPNLRQQIRKSLQPKELQNAFDKPEKLSSLIYEATRPWQRKVEDEMASSGCRNQVENKMFVHRCDKTIVESPAAKLENGHLDSKEKPSRVLVNSNAETSTETLQKVVPTANASDRKGLEQTNQRKVPTILPDKVSKEGGMPASGNGAQKFTRLSALFSKVDDQKAGQLMDKCNILETNGYLEYKDEISRGSVPKPSDVSDLIDCIMRYPLGQEVAGGPGSVISNKTDQNYQVPSQVNMQKLDDEGRQTSSSYSIDRKSGEPSVQSPMKIVYKNGKTDNQEKGNAADSVALGANIPPVTMRHPDNAQDRMHRESLDQYKVIVKFVHKDAGERELIEVFKRFGDILKIELSRTGKSSFKTATVYFKTWGGMQKALQTMDLYLRGSGLAVTLEAASSYIRSQFQDITIPSLIGDPDAPAALVKNPMRTVAIKQLTHKICPRHIEEALAFCESNISGFFLGSSDSVAYVEFETEDGKDRALAKQSIVVLGKRLLIFRVDTPRTTIVRIKTTSQEGVSRRTLQGIVSKQNPVFNSLGNIKAVYTRNATIMDVQFSTTEWPNMLQILNKLNGMQVDGVKLIAEPSPIVPPEILLQIYSQPEERKRLKSNLLRLLQKLDENAVHKTRITDVFSKFYSVQ